MEFAFTEEQQMIRDTAESFLADVSTSEAIRKAMATEQGYDEALWQRICTELYFQSITIPEDFGGMGLGFVELVAVMEQMGRFLLCAPYFSTVCLATTALRVAGTDEQQAEYLPKILEGETATLAFTANGDWSVNGITATWQQAGDDYVLNGHYRYVIDGHTSQNLIVAARAPGSLGDEGVALFVLPASTNGVKTTWLPTLDQTRKQAEIALAGVIVPAAARLHGGASELNKVLQLATVTLAAEQMGGAQQILDKTVAYTQERMQFNRPISSFQSIKHKAADMMLRCEVSRSACYYAACVADEALHGGSLAGELAEAASVAKAYCSEAFFKNAGEAIQMHGGVGFTWEYDVHLYFKRAKASELYLGNAAQHRELIAKQLLD